MLPHKVKAKEEEGKSNGGLQLPSFTDDGKLKRPGSPALHILRPRSKSTGHIQGHSALDDQSSKKLPSDSTVSPKGENVVSISLGGKPIGSVGTKSGNASVKDAFRGVFGRVTEFTDSIAATVIDIKGDTLDISKTAASEFGFTKGQKGLCKDCAKMCFEECLPGKGPTPSQEIYEYIRPLDRVILRREWYLFCRLIFQVLCREENDPLQHPHIKDHIQPSLKGVSFSDWVKKATLIKRSFNTEAVWPFGLSREVPDGEEEVQKLFHPNDKNAELNRASSTISRSSPLLDNIPDQVLIGALTVTKLKQLGGSDLGERDRRILEGVDGALTAALIFSGNKRKRLPCWVLIKLHTRRSVENGLLAVHVAGHNRELSSPLAELSRFHLRIATDKVDLSESGQILRYGRILKEKIDLSLTKWWLGACERHHKCGPPLELRQGLDIPKFRVIDLEKHCLYLCTPDAVQYAALSYVWGDYTYARLDSRTVKIYFDKEALAPERVNLPQAIIDAMAVARGAGLQYLWVDALCIKQDDESEKETQIGQMNKIYANAVVTIVAADGRNANAPLKGVSTEREVDQVVSEVRPKVNVLIPVPASKILEPWETRAWTLQEKLLSNRLIVFSGGYMIWHCREVVHFEDMTAKDAMAILGSDLGYPLLKFGLGVKAGRRLDSASFSNSLNDGTVSVVRSKAFQQYATLVADYTSRGMTCASDVLRALQGILPTLNYAFRRRQKGEYEAFRYGLPQPVLDIALLWQPQGKCERREHCEDCKKPYMPSWSWAGWVGKKDYESPFAVRTDDKGALMQLAKEDGPERIRPLVRFYARGREDLSEWPVLGNCKETKSPQRSVPRKMIAMPESEEVVEMGLLSMLESDETGLIWRKDGSLSEEPRSRPSWLQKGQIPAHWEASHPHSVFAKKIQTGEGFPNIDKRHLVFRTQIAQFKLGRQSQTHHIQIETECAVDDELDSSDYPMQPMDILGVNGGTAVGKVLVHEPEKISGKYYDLIVLSEAQYFGDEESVDVVDYPLYNVMLVTGKDARNNVRTRMGLGKLYKHAWRLSNPIEEVIVLG